MDRAQDPLSVSGQRRGLLWDKQRGTEIKRQPAKLRGVTDLAFSPDGQWFAASNVDKSIKLWRVPGSV